MSKLKFYRINIYAMETYEEFKKKWQSYSLEDKKEIVEKYNQLTEKCMITFECDDPDEAVDKYIKFLEKIADYAMKKYNLPSGKAIKRFFEEFREKEKRRIQLEEELEDKKMLLKSLKPKMSYIA